MIIHEDKIYRVANYLINLLSILYRITNYVNIIIQQAILNPEITI